MQTAKVLFSAGSSFAAVLRHWCDRAIGKHDPVPMKTHCFEQKTIIVSKSVLYIVQSLHLIAPQYLNYLRAHKEMHYSG